MAVFSQATSAARVPALFADWRYSLSVVLLTIAAFPIKLFSVPGFEVTPSLLLAPAAALLFQPKSRAHIAVAAFMALCFLLAIFGKAGTAGTIRNLLGAASYSSGAPYLLVGMTIAAREPDLRKFLRILAPAAMAVTVIFSIDIFLNGGRLVQESSYQSSAYSAEETTYIASAFPFYGEYAVITLATVAMALGSLALGAAGSFKTAPIRYLAVGASSVLLALVFMMWSRQVMLGIGIFVALVTIMSYRRKETWLLLATFVLILVPWAVSMQNFARAPDIPSVSSPELSDELAYEDDELASEAQEELILEEVRSEHKLTRAIYYILTGNFDELSTGRLPLYREAITNLTPRTLAMGCGFCDLKDVYGFEFSSLHNVPLTAVYKGGLVYTFIYVGIAFAGLLLLFRLGASFARAAAFAALASLLVQSMVNDVLFFQVIPALLFALSGYLWVVARRGRAAG